jgi:hypothetical protein
VRKGDIMKKEMEQSGEKPLPRVKVIRRNSAGQDIPMEVGIQPALLDETDPQFTIKGKPITPIEQEVADSAVFGRVRPETAALAQTQRRAILNRVEKDASGK